MQNKEEKEQGLTLLIENQKSVHPIAKITHTSGLHGSVRLRPLSRYFEDYIDNKPLMLGFNDIRLEAINLEFINGIGKKRKFKFQGFDSIIFAKKLVGKKVFIEASSHDRINLISEGLLGYKIVTDKGKKFGHLRDVMWLPNNDAYVINYAEKEYLIPIIPEIIISIDHISNQINIKHMDGLID